MNKHGLSRDIPAPIEREVRQACGFGCIICGGSITDYEHIDPEFHDAKVHDPAAMGLLCPQCHGKVTRKFWSKDKVKAARTSPRCKEEGFSWGEFDFGGRRPSIKFAGVTLKNCQIPIEVRGTPLFKISEPEEPGAPFRLTATFFDWKGRPVLQIVDNIWRANAGSWDIEFTGGRIEIRQEASLQCLVLRAEPPDGIAIEKLRMKVAHLELVGDTETLTCTRPDGSVVTYGRLLMDNFHVGLSL